MHNKTEPNEHKRQSLIKTAKYCSGGGEAELQEEENLEEDWLTVFSRNFINLTIMFSKIIIQISFYGWKISDAFFVLLAARLCKIYTEKKKIFFYTFNQIWNVISSVACRVKYT